MSTKQRKPATPAQLAARKRFGEKQKAVAKLMKEKGISRKEANELYDKQHKKGGGPKKRSTATKKKATTRKTATKKRAARK